MQTRELSLPLSAPLVTADPKSLVRVHNTLAAAANTARTAAARAMSEGAPLGQVTIKLGQYTERPDVGGILLFTLLIEELSKAGWVVTGHGQKTPVERINQHFAHLWSPKTTKSTVSRDQGDFLLREITHPDAMIDDVEEWARSIREVAPKATAADLAMWEGQVSEVTANAFQHARVDDGGHLFVAGEACKTGVRLAVVDSGRTIPGVLGPAIGGELADPAVVRQALERGVTSRCVCENQGFGLASLVRCVKNNAGSLYILSRRGMAYVTNRGRTVARGHDIRHPMMGTLSIINLRTGT